MAMRILMAFGAALFVTAAANAHHSFPAYYFEDQTITIEGEVAEFDYRAPHAWVHVLVGDANGQIQRFSAEWANPQRLMRDGITRDSLKPGDRVVVTGSPGRTASERKMHLKRVVRPADGWMWSGMRRNAATRR